MNSADDQHFISFVKNTIAIRGSSLVVHYILGIVVYL